MTKSNKDLISNITAIITLILMTVCGVLLMIAIGQVLSALVVMNEQHVIINTVVKNSLSNTELGLLIMFIALILNADK